jgi:MarR family transcriptional regulator for hemolysin
MAIATRQVPDLSFLLNHVSYVLRTRMDAAFAEIGLTPRGYCVLSKAMSGEYTQIELAKMSDLDKTTMVNTLDELEGLGYAERRPSPADRRARIVVVSPAGAEAVDDGTRIADRVHREVRDAIPPGQREVFESALNTLADGLLADPVECDHQVRRPRV